MNKAYSYIRFSDPSQAEGDSYRRQLEDTVAYCKEHKLTLVSDSEYMFFDKGVSAYSGKLRDDKTELSRFLSLVEDGSIAPGSVLIIESLDRLSREHVRSALPRFMDLLNAGISIHTLHSNKTYAQDYDEMDLFQSILEISRSHRESLWKSQRIASKWKQKQEAAVNGVPLGKTRPTWLDLVYDERDKENPKRKPIGYEPNKDKVAIVKRIFQLTVDGYGRNVIAQMLNQEGISAFKVKTWGASSIHKLLNSETVLGLYQPTTVENGKRVPRGKPFPFYPPIIDRTLYEAAQSAVAGRNTGKARKQTPQYQIWQGLAKCFLCGGPMHSYGNGRKPKQEGKAAPRWMRCYNAKKGKCEGSSVSVQKIEPLFREILAKLNVLALVQSSANAINTKLNAVTAQLISERAKLSDFKADYAALRSKSILSLMIETEGVVEALEAEERTLLADLAADQIIDKEEFFAKLDLHSFAARSRANSILKRLKVEIRINPARSLFRVVKDGKAIFDIVDAGAGFYFYPGDYEHSAIIQKQEGTFTPYLIPDYDDDSDSEDEDRYENEGHMIDSEY